MAWHGAGVGAAGGVRGSLCLDTEAHEDGGDGGRDSVEKDPTGAAISSAITAVLSKHACGKAAQAAVVEAVSAAINSSSRRTVHAALAKAVSLGGPAAVHAAFHAALDAARGVPPPHKQYMPTVYIRRLLRWLVLHAPEPNVTLLVPQASSAPAGASAAAAAACDPAASAPPQSSQTHHACEPGYLQHVLGRSVWLMHSWRRSPLGLASSSSEQAMPAGGAEDACTAAACGVHAPRQPCLQPWSPHAHVNLKRDYGHDPPPDLRHYLAATRKAQRDQAAHAARAARAAWEAAAASALRLELDTVSADEEYDSAEESDSDSDSNSDTDDGGDERSNSGSDGSDSDCEQAYQGQAPRMARDAHAHVRTDAAAPPQRLPGRLPLPLEQRGPDAACHPPTRAPAVPATSDSSSVTQCSVMAQVGTRAHACTVYGVRLPVLLLGYCMLRAWHACWLHVLGVL